MTIPVSPADLGGVVARFGAAYLLTHGDRFVRVLTVDPTIDGEEVVITGDTAVRRAEQAPEGHVTVVWPPLDHHGHTLIVDGYARVDGDEVRVRLDHAILHRPSAHSDGPPWTP